MTYKFTNTEKSLQSTGLIWDSSNPFKIGNIIYPTYDPCESATVPLRGVLSVADGDGHLTEVPFMAANDGNWIVMVVKIGIYWYRFDRVDLKSCLEAASDFSNYGDSVETMTCYVNSYPDRAMNRVCLYQVPRIFTWESVDDFILERFEIYRHEGSTFSEHFVHLEDGKILCKQNNHVYQEAVVEDLGNGEIMATFPYWILRHKKAACLFVDTPDGVYEYEQWGPTFDIELARREISAKIFYDKERSIGNEIVYANLVGMELTVEDSYSVGNCRSGTASFINKFNLKLNDGIFVITEENRELIWNLALKERQFLRVLKYKVLKNGI